MQLKRASLDLGIVTANESLALAFYCGTLGLEKIAVLPFPGVGTVTKLRCGDGFIKLLLPDKMPANLVARGGYAAATGFRYCSLSIQNIEVVMQRCRADGHKIVVEVRQLRPGVKAAMVEDPDGNTIEFMQED